MDFINIKKKSIKFIKSFFLLHKIKNLFYLKKLINLINIIF